jgi:hypothetical protein
MVYSNQKSSLKKSLLQIRDVYPGSRFRKKIPDPHQRIYVFLTQTIASKLSEI